MATLAAIAIALAGCAANDDSTYVEPIAAKTLEQVEKALSSAYPAAEFTTTTQAQTLGVDEVCAYRSEDRHVDLALGSESTGGVDKLAEALATGLGNADFQVVEPLTTADDGWLVLTGADTNGVTFIFRAKDYAEFFVTAEVETSSCVTEGE